MMLHAPLRLIIIMFPLSDPRLKRVGAGVRWMTRCYADSRATGLYGFRTISHLLGLRRIIPNLCAGLWSDMSVHVIPSPPHLVRCSHERPCLYHVCQRSYMRGSDRSYGGLSPAQVAKPKPPSYPLTLDIRRQCPSAKRSRRSPRSRRTRPARRSRRPKTAGTPSALSPRSLPPIPGPSPHLLQ